MACGCEEAKDKIGFQSENCLIHGGGGLRELQHERQQARYDQWVKDHPILNALRKIELKLRYPGIKFK